MMGKIEPKAVCPKCGRASALWVWNNATKDCYGDEDTDIVPITEGDFADNGQFSGEPADCLYKCPKCGRDDIFGMEIKVCFK